MEKEIFASDVERCSEIKNIAVTKRFDAAEQEAIMQHRVTKRERDNLQEIPAPGQIFTLGKKTYDLPQQSIESIKNNLNSLKAKKDKLLEEKGMGLALALNTDLVEQKKSLRP